MHYSSGALFIGIAGLMLLVIILIARSSGILGRPGPQGSVGPEGAAGRIVRIRGPPGEFGPPGDDATEAPVGSDGPPGAVGPPTVWTVEQLTVPKGEEYAHIDNRGTDATLTVATSEQPPLTKGTVTRNQNARTPSVFIEKNNLGQLNFTFNLPRVITLFAKGLPVPAGYTPDSTVEVHESLVALKST